MADEDNSPEPEGVEREIGGVVYKIAPLKFGQGIKALNRLNKIMLPVIAAGMRGGALEGNANILEAIATVLSDDDIEYFSTLFGACAFYKKGEAWRPLVRRGNVDKQADHFDGKYLEFIRWLIFGVEVNFGNFFNGGTGGGLLELFKGAVKPSKASPPNSG